MTFTRVPTPDMPSWTVTVRVPGLRSFEHVRLLGERFRESMSILLVQRPLSDGVVREMVRAELRHLPAAI